MDFETMMARALARLEADECERVGAALRDGLSAAVGELDRHAQASKVEARWAEQAVLEATVVVDRALERLGSEVARAANRALADASERMVRVAEAAESHAVRVEHRLEEVERRTRTRERVLAEMPRAAVLAVVALVGMALGAGAAVLGAATRRADAVRDAVVAEAQAEGLRAMARSLWEDHGLALLRRGDDVVLALPEGARFERVVSIAGAVFERGTTWRVDQD